MTEKKCLPVLIERLLCGTAGSVGAFCVSRLVFLLILLYIGKRVLSIGFSKFPASRGRALHIIIYNITKQGFRAEANGHSFSVSSGVLFSSAGASSGRGSGEKKSPTGAGGRLFFLPFL